MNFDSLIFQNAEECFIDPADQQWFEERGIKTKYQISYDTGDIEVVREVLHNIMAALGGRICSDTDDFEPSWHGGYTGQTHMNSQQIAYFLEVVRQGSFTKAAQVL